MTNPPNPRHAAYNAMTEDEQDEHIRQHTGVVETCVEVFEMTTGHSVHLMREATWGPSIRYTARLLCMNQNIPIDRFLPLEDQMGIMEHYLAELLKKYEHWAMERSLQEILKMHGVTEARAA